FQRPRKASRAGASLNVAGGGRGGPFTRRPAAGHDPQGLIGVADPISATTKHRRAFVDGAVHRDRLIAVLGWIGENLIDAFGSASSGKQCHGKKNRKSVVPTHHRHLT